MTPPFAAAVFDLDGTLIDSYEAILECLNLVRETYGKEPVSLDECRRLVGHGLQSLIVRAIGEEDADAGVRLFRERYALVGPEKTSLLPEAEAVTAALAARGIPMAIASNKPSAFSRQLADALGIGARFASVVGPDSGFPPKPDPAMVRHALSVMGVRPEETLFVGDMEVDVATARAAGMKVAVVPTGSCTREELLESGADWLLDRLADVLPLFGGGNGQCGGGPPANR
jgi:phosphoglycolate phosphatase